MAQQGIQSDDVEVRPVGAKAWTRENPRTPVEKMPDPNGDQKYETKNKE